MSGPKHFQTFLKSVNPGNEENFAAKFSLTHPPGNQTTLGMVLRFQKPQQLHDKKRKNKHISTNNGENTGVIHLFNSNGESENESGGNNDDNERESESHDDNNSKRESQSDNNEKESESDNDDDNSKRESESASCQTKGLDSA